MFKLTNKEYDEWLAYKKARREGHILMPDGIRIICEVNHFDPTEIGKAFLELLPKVAPPSPYYGDEEEMENLGIMQDNEPTV